MYGDDDNDSETYSGTPTNTESESPTYKPSLDSHKDPFLDGLYGIGPDGCRSSDDYSRYEHGKASRELITGPTSTGSGSSPSTGGGGCFVVTASYGDTNHPIVNEFRGFRDDILKPTTAGKAFVEWYYKHGPVIAAFIEDKPVLKAIARSVLRPLASVSRFLRGRVNAAAPSPQPKG